MITRKLGKLLRGNATPFQIIAACVLGALLGFAPPPARGPALYALLLAALLVTNANLGLALLVGGCAKLLSLLIAPLSFQVGRFLLDGPASGLARTVVNAPILAWCGLEYYGTAGGLLLAVVLGLVAGLLLSRSITSFRRKMAAAAENPSRLNELAAKPWAKCMLWLLLGKAAKGTWEERLAKRFGNPVRMWGAALVVLALLGFWFGQKPLASALARKGLQSGLETANGATVDLGGVELDLNEGRLGVSGLALADPNALDRDLFKADVLQADVDQADFLRRRVHMASIVIKEASSGSTREAPGKRLTPAPEPTETAPPAEGERTLEDVLAEAEVWKERLEQAKRWLDELSGDGEEEVLDPTGESWSERLAREVAEKGWLNVPADHLVADAPTFRLSQLLVEGFTFAGLPDQVFDLEGSELSTHPWLVDDPTVVQLASRDGSISFAVDLAPASRAGGDGALRMTWKGLSVDAAMAQLKLPGPAPLSGGTLDLEIDGTWADGKIGWLDLPLKVTLRNTTFDMSGVEPTLLEQLVLPIGLSGPIDAPRIQFDASDFADALQDAGQRALAGKLMDRLDEELGDDLPIDLPDDVEEDAKGVLEGLLGRKP